MQTCRGSHTHTLVTDPNDKANLYVYGSGTAGVRSAEELAGCSGNSSKGRSEHRALQHRRDPGAARRAAERAIVNQPRIFADPTTGDIAGLWHGGGNAPAGTRRRPAPITNQCHDITVFPGDRPGGRRLRGQRHPARHLRSGEPGAARRRRRQELRLLALGDVQQRRHEGDLHRRVGRRHAAALPRDRPAELGRRRDLRHRRPQDACSRSYYKMPAPQTEPGELRRAQRLARSRCPGRDIMVQAWYQGGVSVFDFTDSAHPVEIAFFDRGPIDAERADHSAATGRPTGTTATSTATEIARGLDVFELTPSDAPLAERDRRGGRAAVRAVQRAAPAPDQLGAELRARPRLPRPGRPSGCDRRRHAGPDRQVPRPGGEVLPGDQTSAAQAQLHALANQLTGDQYATLRASLRALSDASAPHKPKHVPAKPSLKAPSHTGQLPPQEEDAPATEEIAPAD